MSRSRKKVPGFKDHSVKAKFFANKKVRRSVDIQSGGWYKRISGNIGIMVNGTYVILSVCYSHQQKLQQKLHGTEKHIAHI